MFNEVGLPCPVGQGVNRHDPLQKQFGILCQFQVYISTHSFHLWNLRNIVHNKGFMLKGVNGGVIYKS